MSLTLTHINLRNEYFDWVHAHGNGRNKEDLRFGQFLHLKYNLEFMELEGNEDDCFYTEGADEAFTNIIKLLQTK